MLKIITLLSVFLIICSADVSHKGPYIMWGGHPEINNIYNLERTSDVFDELTSIYKDVKIVLVFVTDDTYRTNTINFPKTNEIACIDKYCTFVSHERIPDPTVYVNDVKVILLNGSAEERDTKIRDTYASVSEVVGIENVLAILGHKDDEDEGGRHKREAEAESSTSSTTASPAPAEEVMKEDFIYIATGKAMLYTTSAPILSVDNTSTEEKPFSRELKSHGIVKVDERDQLRRLIVTFATEDVKTTLRFRFPITAGYWSLTSVEVEDKEFKNTLEVVGEPPSAPLSFSHKCSRSLIFKNGTMSLTMENVQVQPWLGSEDRFSDAYDCIGFTTVPIWSGIFVSFLILIGTGIGINAIMEIKTPTRFESSRSKQLTFTVQE